MVVFCRRARGGFLVLWDMFSVVGGSVLLSVVAALVVNRLLPAKVRIDYNELSSHFFAAVGAFYTVLLAFVVVAVWEDMNAAKDNTYVEANALPGIYFSSTAFGEREREELQEIAVSYADAVVTQEWPLLAEGKASPRVDEIAQRMRRTLLRLEPTTPKQEALYSAMIERVNAINSARRERLNEAHPSIPGFLWVGLVVGGVLVVGLALFFGAPRALPHILMVAVLVVLVSTSLYYAHLMDHPFLGSISVNPEAFRVALRQMGHTAP